MTDLSTLMATQVDSEATSLAKEWTSLAELSFLQTQT